MLYNVSELQMKDNNMFSNIECWKDHFLADKEEFSDDKLPPEVKTYCQVVDGISKNNGLNILVVPILCIGDYEHKNKYGIKQILGGVNDDNELDNMKDLIEERKKYDYYKLVNKKYKELRNDNKPFGVLYVYHNKYCIKHVEPCVLLDGHNVWLPDGSHNRLPIEKTKERKNNLTYNNFYFEDNNFYRDYFSCRIFAIQFLLSLYKNKDYMLNLDKKKFSFDSDWMFGCLPEDFIKYAQVDIDLLARLLCIFDKIRENKCQLDEYEDLLWKPEDYLTKYSNNDKLKQKLLEKIKQFNISNEEIKQKTYMLKKDIYRQNADGKWCNVGLAKLGAEWYAKYAGKKFLKEHNDIIKNYNKEYNRHIEYNNEIEESDAYFHENFDTHYADPNNQYKPDRHGALATIDETYKKIMEQKKNSKNQQSTQNNNANSKDSNDKINGNANNEDNNSRNFFKKIDNNELNGKGNKEEIKKLKTSRNEENNKNEFVNVNDENISENLHSNTDKQQEATDTTGNRCWPFGWCSSCNGCACISNKGIDEYQQTFGK